jgi:protein TonB
VGETRDARVVTPPRPSYPPNAVRNRQNGWVEVEFTVTEGGSVQNVRVISSDPPRVFDREAIRAVQQATFEAKLERGQPVSSTLRRRIEFKLGT